MNILLVLFFVSLVFGQVTAIPLAYGRIYLHDFIAVLIVIVYLLFQRKKKTAKPVLLAPLLAFAGIASLSLILRISALDSNEFYVSAMYLLRFVVYASLYFIARNYGHWSFWYSGLLAVGSALAFLGLIQYFLYPNLRNLEYLGWDPHYYRVFSTLLDPNFAGIIFVLALFLGFSFIPISKNKWLISAAIILNLTALVMTFSRSSYLSFFIGFLAWCSSKKKWLVLFLGFVSIIILFIVVPKPGIGYTPLNRASTTLARIENWQYSLTLIRKSPLFGFGFNTLRFVQEDRKFFDPTSHAAGGVDNSFLFVAITTGFIGLSAFLWFLYTLFTIGWRFFKSDIHLVYVISLLSIIIHSLFINSLFYPWVLVWIFLTSGALETVNLRKE